MGIGAVKEIQNHAAGKRFAGGKTIGCAAKNRLTACGICDSRGVGAGGLGPILVGGGRPLGCKHGAGDQARGISALGKLPVALLLIGCGLKAAGGIEKVLEAVAGRVDLGGEQPRGRVLEAVGGAVRVADPGEMVLAVHRQCGPQAVGGDDGKGPAGRIPFDCGRIAEAVADENNPAVCIVIKRVKIASGFQIHRFQVPPGA